MRSSGPFSGPTASRLPAATLIRKPGLKHRSNYCRVREPKRSLPQTGQLTAKCGSTTTALCLSKLQSVPRRPRLAGLNVSMLCRARVAFLGMSRRSASTKTSLKNRPALHRLSEICGKKLRSGFFHPKKKTCPRSSMNQMAPRLHCISEPLVDLCHLGVTLSFCVQCFFILRCQIVRPEGVSPLIESLHYSYVLIFYRISSKSTPTPIENIN